MQEFVLIEYPILDKPLRVVELFAGVGGFRIGLEGVKNQNNSNPNFKIVWSNQWEPKTKCQHASLVYEKNFGSVHHSNIDINSVDSSTIPNHDMLVAGFPCQDYSVASTLKNSGGLIGKKGVLWWQIYRILKEKGNQKPSILLLENVDRLLKSPVKQRGRDFAVILASLSNLGYNVEWRVINAADYGMPQRRRRIFIMAYKKTSKIGKLLSKSNVNSWLGGEGVLSSCFPVESTTTEKVTEIEIGKNIAEVSQDFNLNTSGRLSPFHNSGIMISNRVFSLKTKPKYSGTYITLRDILEEGKVADEYYLQSDNMDRWVYLKGSKKEPKVTKDGFKYFYSEGALPFPDSLDKSSRTIITGEGGKSPSRFKHVVETEFGLRRLTPVELERLNMFPDNFTEIDNISNGRRAFLMGNALVVGIINKIGEALSIKLAKK